MIVDCGDSGCELMSRTGQAGSAVSSEASQESVADGRGQEAR